MLAHTSFTWLLWKGLVPLFGANVVYMMSGFYKQLASPGTTFAWAEAIDSMGWLYGALIISVQSAVQLFSIGTHYLYHGIGCIVCAFVCGMQLLAAMGERGADRSCQPSLRFKSVAVVVVVVILVSGCFVRSIPSEF
jgi:hypothetical protein